MELPPSNIPPGSYEKLLVMPGFWRGRAWVRTEAAFSQERNPLPIGPSDLDHHREAQRCSDIADRLDARSARAEMLRGQVPIYLDPVRVPIAEGSYASMMAARSAASASVCGVGSVTRMRVPSANTATNAPSQDSIASVARARAPVTSPSTTG